MSGIPKNVQNARRGRFNRQTGLKMQGDANRVDLSRLARRAIRRRVQTTFKVKGYDSEYRCDHGIDPNTASEEAKESYCYNTNEPGTVLLDPAPFHQSAAGGVGHIYYPRRRCNFKCSADIPPPPKEHCNYVLELESHINPIKKVDASGITTFDQSFCRVKFTWERPPVWDETDKDKKYNYLKVNFMEIIITEKGKLTPIEIGYPTTVNNSYTCKSLLKFNTNYIAKVINHCCCGVGTATINFPTGPPIPNPQPPSQCSIKSSCDNSNFSSWYGTVVSSSHNYKKNDTYGWGFNFNSTSDYELNHLKKLNCISSWTFQIYPFGSNPKTANAIEIFKTTTDHKNFNTIGKILNDANHYFFTGIHIYHFTNVRATNFKNIFYSQDPNFKQNTKYDLYINANVTSDTKCSPETYGPITITTGKDVTPPPPPSPSSTCPSINPHSNWLGTITANGIKAIPGNDNTYGIQILWSHFDKIDKKIINNEKYKCVSSWSITLKDKVTNAITWSYNTSSLPYQGQTIKLYNTTPPGSSGTALGDVLQANREYLVILEAIPTTSIGGVSISEQITVTSGTGHCNAENFIGSLKATTINSETSDSNEYGFKITIDDTKISTSNLSMLKEYKIDLYSPLTTTPLLTKTISHLAKINSFEILKTCPSSGVIENCFEYSGLDASSNYDVKITGIFNDTPQNFGSKIIDSDSNYVYLDSSKEIYIKDSINWSEYKYYKTFFESEPKNLLSITNGNTIRYSFDVIGNTVSDRDRNAGDNYAAGNDEFATLWIGISDYQVDDQSVKSQEERIIRVYPENWPRTYIGLDNYRTNDAGNRKKFYIAVSITYHSGANNYTVKMYHYNKSNNSLDFRYNGRSDRNDDIFYNISRNESDEFYLELGDPINDEIPVHFSYGSQIDYEFPIKLNNKVSHQGKFKFLGSFGSKGVKLKNLQFTPNATDCDTPIKSIAAISGNKPSPGPPAPTPPPKPIYSKEMPQLYLTTYGNSAFKGLSQIIGQQDVLSQYIRITDPGIPIPDSPKDKFRKIAELKWYIIRSYNINYFTSLKPFIVNPKNNIKNYMILIGDYLPLIPPQFEYSNVNFDTMLVKNSGCPTGTGKIPLQYGYSSEPYPLNSVNGPVDFGLPYSTTTPDVNYQVVRDVSNVFNTVGCSFILDHIIPLAIANKNEGRSTKDIEITTNADITPNDQAWKTWDVGNYNKSKYNVRYSTITRNDNNTYTITNPQFDCNSKQIQPELAYFTVSPSRFNNNDFSTQISNSKLNKIIQCNFTRVNDTVINTITITGFVTGSSSDLNNGMFVDFDVDLGLSTTTFKKADDTNPEPIRIQSYTSTTITLNQGVKLTDLTGTGVEAAGEILFLSNYYSGGNIFIGDGSGLNSSNNRIEPGYGCGRSTHFEPSGNNINVIDLNANDENFYNYGSRDADLQTLQYGINSFPLDNLHQYFITVYFINQKIMELNYHIKNGNLQIATLGKNDLLPLITHIHSDRESASPYAGSPGPYPSCDASGNIMLSSNLGGDANPGGGLGDTVSVGYWKYLYNKYMPGECLPVWRRHINHDIHHTGQENTMDPTSYGIKVPNTNEILWDQSKEWNIGQLRNFHQDASSNLNLGFSITSNDLRSVKKGDATDGIQRYQTGWINTKTTSFLRNTGEGLLEAYQEIYNLGEVKPPLSFAKNDTERKNIMDEYITINATTQNKNAKISFEYGTKYKLPEKPATKNIIIQNSNGTFGSGIIPGSDFPPSKGNVGNNNNLTEQLHYRLNSIYNPLIGRIAKKYGTNLHNFIGATSIIGLEGYNSPALSDLWMRQMGKKLTASTSADFELPAVPFDGRGFHPNSNSIASVDKTTTGVDRSDVNFLNGSKNTDGYYLPIDASFCNLTTGEINLSDIYASSILNNQPWGSKNSVTPGSGPQEAIATFSFEYQGGATGIDPRIAMPGGTSTNSKRQPWGETQTGKFDYNSLAFTDTNRTFATKMYGDMGGIYFKPDKLINTFGSDYTEAIGNILGSKGKQQTKLYVLPACEIETKCTDYSGTDLAYSGLDYKTVISQYLAADKFGISYGWVPQSNSFGGETNILSSLGANNNTHFNPMKNFLKAAAMCMGGPNNVGKIKVGLYSQEFLPIAWMSDPTPQHEI